mmetsp:Transcript_22654/g.26642  ORF Transcript_22654/g.26642 Transcript_22654/m.26642 type:complete len:131 (-) Transcript_22654:3-395(-)
MCECNSINMPEEICNADCLKSRVKTSIDDEGNMIIDNGKEIKKKDPSTIPGYYGEFKTASPSGKKEAQAVFVDVGDNFSFDYSVNDDLLDSVDMKDNTDRSTAQQKLFFGMYYLDPWSNTDDPGRHLRAM